MSDLRPLADPLRFAPPAATALIRQWEACNSTLPPVPVLAVTANSSEVDQVVYAAHGADGVVRAPPAAQLLPPTSSQPARL